MLSIFEYYIYIFTNKYLIAILKLDFSFLHRVSKLLASTHLGNWHHRVPTVFYIWWVKIWDNCDNYHIPFISFISFTIWASLGYPNHILKARTYRSCLGYLWTPTVALKEPSICTSLTREANLNRRRAACRRSDWKIARRWLEPMEHDQHLVASCVLTWNHVAKWECVYIMPGSNAITTRINMCI